MTARIVYSMNISLDGFIATPDGSLDWANVDEEVHSWFNDAARNSSAFVYGRRMYETMAPFWPDAVSDPDASPVMVDFARVWVDKPKVVFSHTLTTVEWNSRLASGDVQAELARLLSDFDGELDLGGANLAAQFIERGLVDSYRPVVHPVVLGAGAPYFPPGVRLDLRLTEMQRFANGAVMLGYVPR